MKENLFSDVHQLDRMVDEAIEAKISESGGLCPNVKLGKLVERIILEKIQSRTERQMKRKLIASNAANVRWRNAYKAQIEVLEKDLEAVDYCLFLEQLKTSSLALEVKALRSKEVVVEAPEELLIAAQSEI